MEIEKEFGWGYQSFISGLKFAEHHPLHSYSNFKDILTFAMTIACGCFTLGLLTQTVYYVYRQTSLVDQAKRKRYNTEVRKERYQATAMKEGKASDSDTTDSDEDAQK